MRRLPRPPGLVARAHGAPAGPSPLRNGSGRVAGRPMTTTRSRPLRTQQSTPADPGAARPATAPAPIRAARRPTNRVRTRSARAAGSSSSGSSRSSTAGATPSSGWSATTCWSRPTSTPTVMTCSTRRCCCAWRAAAGREAAGGSRRCGWSTTIAGPAASGSTATRGIATPSRPGATPSAACARALLKKVEAQVELATELAEMRVLLEAALLRARGHGRAGAGDATLIEEALAGMRRARSDAGRAAAISGEELLAAVRRHPDRSAATRSAELPLMVDRERARFGAWYELFPRSQGRDPARAGGDHLRRRDLAPAGDRAARLRRRLPAAHPSHRPHQSQGRQQHAEGQGRRPGQPVRHRLSRGRPRRGGAGARRPGRAASVSRGGGGPGHGAGAGPRHPGLAGPSVGRASIRTWFRHAPDGTIKFAENPPKKYQDIYPIEFGNDDPEQRTALWTRLARHRPDLGRARDPHLPGRQPAHQADPVLALADRRCPARAPRRHLPVGGVHPAEDDAAAGQDRLQPELHLLHLARDARRAARVLHRAHPDPDARVLPRRTCSPTRRTSTRTTWTMAGRRS